MQESKTSAPVVSHSFQSVWMEFGLRPVGVMILILILSCLFNFQGREPSLCDFVFLKTLKFQTLIDQFLSNLV